MHDHRSHLSCRPRTSASEALAEKSAIDTSAPFGMTSTWTGANGLMSWKASDH